MQKQENFISEGHWSTFCIKVPFGIGHPPPTHQMQSTCVREGSRVQNLQTEFNYLDSFKSYCRFSDFVVAIVPTSSPWSPHRPRHPRIIPIVPTSSPYPSEGPHVVPMISVVSTCCPRGLHMLSPWSPRCPCRPCIIPSIPTSSLLSPHHPHSPQNVPMWSPWSVVSVVFVVSTCCPCGPQIIPVIPVIPMSSPHHLEGPHIIPNPSDTHLTHPPPPWGWGAPNQ